MHFPKIAPVRQHLTTDHIADVPTHVRHELARLPLAERIRPGTSVAVGVGSRGIGCIREVVTTLVDELLALGAQPYLVPAMGSHGGGTAAGQEEVLIGYGLGPAQLGIPIRSSMETTVIGETPSGMPVYWDVNAAQADAVIVVNRIKPHTAFRNRWESGLFKMLSVGFGKAEGAATIHSWGIAEAMPAAARVVLAKKPVVAGIAIVENGQHQPAEIAALAAEEIEAREPELLEHAWRHLPRIPLEPLDLLVLQEIGKDISGTGMDLNVVGMWRRTGGPVQPDFRAITALDLTPNSHGNAVGVGYCDLIPQRLCDKVDWPATYTNCLTAGNFNGGKRPITLPTDRDVIAAALPRAHPDQARMVIARNTLDLGLLWVSTALLSELARYPNLEQIGPPQPLAFDAGGSLTLPEAATVATHEGPSSRLG
ncbi:MAG TPA: hypothetical protein VNK95_11705 [Caldilineaceae bacterium]|nr:hypothetical protein [Caldilineaceae bacterium]